MTNSNRLHEIEAQDRLLMLLLVILLAVASSCSSLPEPRADKPETTAKKQSDQTAPVLSNAILARWPDQFQVVVEFKMVSDIGSGRPKGYQCVHDLKFSRTDDGWDVRSDYAFDVPSAPASDQEINLLYAAIRCLLPSFSLDADGNKTSVEPLAQYEAAREVLLEYYNRRGGERGLGESVARLGSVEMKRLDVERLLTHLVPPPWMLNLEVDETSTIDTAELDHVIEASVVRLEDGLAADVNCRIFKSSTVSLPGPETVDSMKNITAPLEDRDFGEYRVVDEIHFFLDPEIGVYRGAVGNKTIEGGSFTGDDALSASQYIYEVKSYQPL